MRKTLEVILFTLAAACGDEVKGSDKVYVPPGDVSNIDAGSSYDGGQSQDAGQPSDRITSETRGVAIMVNELQSAGYLVQLQTGWGATVYDSQSAEHVLEPDLRFRRTSGDVYSYLEFNSPEDPGVGFTSVVPLYVEIQPGTEEEIREEVGRVLTSS